MNKPDMTLEEALRRYRDNIGGIWFVPEYVHVLASHAQARSDVRTAIAHLEDAEATIMSWWDRMDNDADEDGEAELPFATMLAAVLRSVSRAAGALEDL